jgi:hypothetical protein
MNVFLLLGLLVCAARVYAQDAGPLFSIGFEEDEYCAVEGGSFVFCIVVKSGSAAASFNFTINRSYQQGNVLLLAR